MNKKYLNIIYVVVIIIVVGSVIYLTANKKISTDNQNTDLPAQSNTEEPVDQTSVKDQPAYLISVYSKNGKNYIDVDYVEWFHGDLGIQAMIKDGECGSTKDCYIYGNGYKRNLNPKIRTLEVSQGADIKSNGSIGLSLGGKPEEPISISFKAMEDYASKTEPYASDKPPFKPVKGFILIDVKDGMVTKINEPYQE